MKTRERKREERERDKGKEGHWKSSYGEKDRETDIVSILIN